MLVLNSRGTPSLLEIFENCFSPFVETLHLANIVSASEHKLLNMGIEFRNLLRPYSQSPARHFTTDNLRKRNDVRGKWPGVVNDDFDDSWAVVK